MNAKQLARDMRTMFNDPPPPKIEAIPPPSPEVQKLLKVWHDLRRLSRDEWLKVYGVPYPEVQP